MISKHFIIFMITINIIYAKSSNDEHLISIIQKIKLNPKFSDELIQNNLL